MDDVIPAELVTGLPAKAILRLLREQAGLSLAQMARTTGMEKQGYYYYETRYKGRYLPSNVAPAIVRALVGAGVDPAMAARLEPPPAAVSGRREISRSLDHVVELLTEIRDLLRARPRE